MSIGNRIFTQRPAFDVALLEPYQQLPVANIADTMNRIAVLGNGIRRISSPVKPVMAGYAITVKARAGDNLMLHAALDMATENDVIVVSNEGDRSRALMGEIMIAYAHYDRKIAGIVLDGPVRDIDALSVLDFPIFATGSNPAGPFKEGPGEVNTPHCCRRCRGVSGGFDRGRCGRGDCRPAERCRSAARKSDRIRQL
ncbi:regulator of RNase E activity RraA [Pantoea anthophila]|nr:regulator of RNase E activity RraA [Pantoea anthophila]